MVALTDFHKINDNEWEIPKYYRPMMVIKG